MRRLFFLFLVLSLNSCKQPAKDSISNESTTKDSTINESTTKDSAALYNSFGNSKANLKNYTGAIADYTKAISLNTQYSDAYFNRGLSKYELHDNTGACEDWSKAGELGNVKAYDKRRLYCQ